MTIERRTKFVRYAEGAKMYSMGAELGFEKLSSFACNLCDEYVKLFGDPDFSAVKNRKV